MRASPDPWAERLSVPGWRKGWHIAGGIIKPTFYRCLSASPRIGLWTRPARRGELGSGPRSTPDLASSSRLVEGA